MNESFLEKALENSWGSKTSSEPFKWTKENKTLGQCAVTSLIIQDYFGGEIVRAIAKLPDGKEISHYFNNISGIEKDFTRKQFPQGTIIPAGIPRENASISNRECILSYTVTKLRYDILKERVEKYIRTHKDTF
jgi:hypothetical protein